MADEEKNLRLMDLMTRSETFRWLWVRHDEIEALRASGDKRLWSKLSRIGRSLDIPVTRDSLRNAWRAVEVEWARAPSWLRETRAWWEREKEEPRKNAKGAPIGAAVRPRPEISPPPDDDEFQLVSVRKGVPDGQ